MITIYTANVGSRDEPRPQAEQDTDVRWVYYTDDRALEPPRPWHRRQAERPAGEHPNLAAKWFKSNPDTELTADGPAIWIDASMEVTSPGFAREAVAALGPTGQLAAWRHPRRDCIYAEAEASLGAESQGGRYAGLPIREQMDAYRLEGHPEHWGLWACGTIVWTAEAWGIGADWYAECCRWGYQDQLSFPVVCRRVGVRPAEFPVPQIGRRAPRGAPVGGVRRGVSGPRNSPRRGSYLENPWMRIHAHRPGTG